MGRSWTGDPMSFTRNGCGSGNRGGEGNKGEADETLGRLLKRKQLNFPMTS